MRAVTRLLLMIHRAGLLGPRRPASTRLGRRRGRPARIRVVCRRGGVDCGRRLGFTSFKASERPFAPPADFVSVSEFESEAAFGGALDGLLGAFDGSLCVLVFAAL